MLRKQLQGFRLVVVNMLRRTSLGLLFLALSGFAHGADTPSVQALSADVTEAKDLIDSYYGDKAVLVRAKAMLERALAQNRFDAAAFLQMGRVVIKGGVTRPGGFQGSSLQAAQTLYQRAVDIDPRVPRGYVLLAETYRLEDDLTATRATLLEADKVDPDDPSLWNGWAKFYERVDPATALMYYRRLEAKGPGDSADSRKFYVNGVLALADNAARTGDEEGVRKWSAAASKARAPNDAWTLSTCADNFIYLALFDDAIQYDQAALQTMDFGIGRLSLATALYGKAAQLLGSGKTEESAQYAAAAGALGFASDAVVSRMSRSGPKTRRLIPTVTQWLPR